MPKLRASSTLLNWRWTCSQVKLYVSLRGFCSSTTMRILALCSVRTFSVQHNARLTITHILALRSVRTCAVQHNGSLTTTHILASCSVRTCAMQHNGCLTITPSRISLRYAVCVHFLCNIMVVLPSHHHAYLCIMQCADMCCAT